MNNVDRAYVAGCRWDLPMRVFSATNRNDALRREKNIRKPQTRMVLYSLHIYCANMFMQSCSQTQTPHKSVDFTEFCWPLFEKSDETAVFFEKNYKNARRMAKECVLPSSFKTCSFEHFLHHLITWRGVVSAGK